MFPGPLGTRCVCLLAFVHATWTIMRTWKPALIYDLSVVVVV